MYIHKKVLLAVAVVIVLGVVTASTITISRAQTSYTGPTWDYKELVFTEPITFGSNVFGGYFENGKFVTPAPGNEGVTAGNIIMYYGGQGWELIEQNNSQVFYFRRQRS